MEEDKDQQSPCRKQCIINPRTNYCMGCYRTIDEIVKWVNLSEEGKETILKKTEKRRSREHKTRSTENAIWIS